MFSNTLYDKSLYEFESPQPSWWEASIDQAIKIKADTLQSVEACDVAIIGGGYTGLSSAYHLAKDYNVDVRVLEAGHIGWGASGRNGGFCTIGGTPLSAAQQIKQFGLEQTKKFYKAQIDAVELVQNLIEEENIDAQKQGVGEMVVAEKQSHFENMKKECNFNRDVLGINCRLISQDEIRKSHYDAPHQLSLIHI